VRSTSGKSSKRNLTKRGFGICGGARCCREARRRQSAVFSLTYLCNPPYERRPPTYLSKSVFRSLQTPYPARTRNAAL
jgi:hypothetical protein